MRKGIKNTLFALPGIIAVIERWGARAMDLIGLPGAATQLKEWAAYLPEIGSGTYYIIAFSVVGLLIVHLWPKAQPSTTPSADQAETPSLYRAAMEFHVIAGLACGKTPVLPINSGPELQMLRHLKDAATDGRLQATNKDSNGQYYVLSQTTSHDLLDFCERHPKPENLLNFARQWVKEVQPRHYELKAEPGAFRITGENATVGVSKVNESTAQTTEPSPTSPSWCELEQRFRELEPLMQYARIDGQTGAAGEYWRIAGGAERDAERRFIAIAAIASNRLFQDFHDIVITHTDLAQESDPAIRWYKALRDIGGRYEHSHRHLEQRNNDGSSGGFIFIGTINLPAAASATFCLELAARAPQT